MGFNQINQQLDYLFIKQKDLKSKICLIKKKNIPYPKQIFSLYKIAKEAEKNFEHLENQIKRITSNKFLKDMKAKNKVLRHLGYIHKKTGELTKKGIVACFLDSVDEIILTEMIFDDSFKNLIACEIPAFVSCFLDVRDLKDQKITDNEKLFKVFETLKKKIKDVILVMQHYGIDVNSKEYIKNFSPNLMDVILLWCKGSTFAEIVKLTNMFEGELVRNIKRCEEILKQIIDAIKSVGNSNLIKLIKNSLKLLCKGLCFTTSLYINDDQQNKQFEKSLKFFSTNIRKNINNSKSYFCIDVPNGKRNLSEENFLIQMS